MKFKILFFLLLGIFAFSQNQRFIYEYSFRTDSTALDKPLSTEMMFLDVAKKGSKFYSYDTFKADSLIAEMDKKNTPGSHDFSGIKFGKVSSVVEKTYPDFKITFFNRIDLNEYQVTDNREIKWKILPEKEKIGEFQTQKAETVMYGRKWYAWFAPEIPIQDGPYKFHGLPGLIVKVSDPKNTHIFELKALKKLSPQQIWESKADKQSFGTSLLKIDEKQYRKIFQENRENPTKGLRQMMGSGVKIMITDDKGNPMDIDKHLRDQERNAKEQNQKNNNLLEQDLIK